MTEREKTLGRVCSRDRSGRWFPRSFVISGNGLGRRQRGETRSWLNRVTRFTPPKEQKTTTVRHGFALQGERAENQLASIVAPKHEEGADTRYRGPRSCWTFGPLHR